MKWIFHFANKPLLHVQRMGSEWIPLDITEVLTALHIYMSNTLFPFKRSHYPIEYCQRKFEGNSKPENNYVFSKKSTYRKWKSF